MSIGAHGTVELANESLVEHGIAPIGLLERRLAPTGGMLGEDSFRNAFYDVMVAAGIDRKAFPARGGFTFHDLRHSFGTLAVQVSPLHDVQAYMVHADISTTMRYAHHIPKVDAAQRFTDAIRRARAGTTAQSGLELSRIRGRARSDS